MENILNTLLRFTENLPEALETASDITGRLAPLIGDIANPSRIRKRRLMRMGLKQDSRIPGYILRRMEQDMRMGNFRRPRRRQNVPKSKSNAPKSKESALAARRKESTRSTAEPEFESFKQAESKDLPREYYF
jgi:hypothetical protein